MDVNSIMTLISTLGYPIVVSLICFWYINKTREESQAMIQNLRATIDNNTKVMIKICAKLDIETDDDMK